MTSILVFTKRLAVIAALTATAAVCAAPLEIAGSTTVQKVIVDPVTGKAKDAGLELKMLPVGSGKGVQMLFEGKAPVAAISEEIGDAVASAKKAGAANIPTNIKVHTIMTDKLVAVVNADNPVKELSAEQLKGILLGKVQNWKDVGGPDLPIIVVTGAPGSGTRGVVEKVLLGGQGITANAKELRATSAELGEVSRDKGAIGMLGAGMALAAKGKAREIKAPDVSRPLSLVTVGDPNPEVQKLIDFLKTSDAQKLFAH